MDDALILIIGFIGLMSIFVIGEVFAKLFDWE